MLIQCKNLVVGFANKPLVSIPDLAIDEKQIYLLTGPNGCGKTTLLKTLAGWLLPLYGEITWHPLQTALKDISFAPNNTSLFSHLTVYEHFKLAASLSRAIRFTPEILLEHLNLVKERNAYPHQLSSGLKKMVGLGCALLPQTSCVILDEPTSELDRDYRRAVYRLLNQLHIKGTLVLFSSHLEEDKALFPHTLLIQNQNLVWQPSSSKQPFPTEALA